MTDRENIYRSMGKRCVPFSLLVTIGLPVVTACFLPSRAPAPGRPRGLTGTIFIHLFFVHNDFVIEGWYGTVEAIKTPAIFLAHYRPGCVLEIVLTLAAVILLLIPVAWRWTGGVMSACVIAGGDLVQRQTNRAVGLSNFHTGSLNPVYLNSCRSGRRAVNFIS